MGAIFGGGGGGSSAPAPVEPAPTVDDASKKVEESNKKKRAALAQGRQGTILTSGLGDTSAAPTAKKSLLGQ